jgi:hypothetical protein
MVISSSNMNAAVHTNTRVHRCRDDVLGTSGTCLTIPGGHDDTLTLSLPQVLADADADTAVVRGMASVIPAASNVPVTFDFMAPPE